MRNPHSPRCMRDTGTDNLMNGEGDQLLDLVHLDRYGALVHTTPGIAVSKKGDNKTHREPDGAVDPVLPDSADSDVYDTSSDEVARVQHDTTPVGYFVEDYPLINRHCDFTVCKQAPGESFRTWWERKKAMAVECDLGAMTGNDWLRVELVRGENDTRLQKRLLQEQQAMLPQMVLIAKQWQVPSVEVGEDTVSSSLSLCEGAAWYHMHIRSIPCRTKRRFGWRDSEP
jgi:hypothetical protein